LIVCLKHITHLARDCHSNWWLLSIPFMHKRYDVTIESGSDIIQKWGTIGLCLLEVWAKRNDKVVLEMSMNLIDCLEIIHVPLDANIIV